jgi:hypothetical protein
MPEQYETPEQRLREYLLEIQQGLIDAAEAVQNNRSPDRLLNYQEACCKYVGAFVAAQKTFPHMFRESILDTEIDQRQANIADTHDRLVKLMTATTRGFSNSSFVSALSDIARH